ncbi:hypothetical protein ACFX10_019280 [Malus domestica]
MANRRVAALKWKGQVGPRIQKIIDKLKQDAYLKAYSPIITPMPTPDQWPNHVIQPIPINPPVYKKQTGRPKKKRVKEPGEVPPLVASNEGTKLSRWVYTKPFTCTKCGKEGHTKDLWK